MRVPSPPAMTTAAGPAVRDGTGAPPAPGNAGCAVMGDSFGRGDPGSTGRSGSPRPHESPMTAQPALPGAGGAPVPSRTAGPVAVVMAGGLGTRMRSTLPKVLHPLCGRPMLAYVVEAARAATGRDPIVVTSPATAAVRDAFPAGITFALQESPDGSGNAGQ